VRKWLLDTNVISEWKKPKPDWRVAEFLKLQARLDLFTSLVCVVELRRGAEASRETSLRSELLEWITTLLPAYFEDRIIGLGESELAASFHLTDLAKAKRITPAIADVLVAGTAVSRNLAIVTRNIRDFRRLGVPVLNPWTGERFNGA
jgi:hypothetical protein